MSIKMTPVVSDAKKNILYREHHGVDSADVVARQKAFWDLDGKETEYLVQELKKWNNNRRDG